MVEPDTVVRWHRSAWRAYWRWKSRRRSGRPRIPAELRQLIVRIATEHPRWGAVRIVGELRALGFEVSARTVSRYRRQALRRRPSQSWRTFLRNHTSSIWAADLFTVQTLTFRTLSVFVVIDHGRRRIRQGDVDLDEVEVVVIDEADRMSDMGFLPGVKRLLNRTPDDRQTLLFSATLDGDVAVLARNYQRDPVRHEIGDPEPNVEDMRHLFWRLESSGRVEVASNLIQAAGPTIVFCRTRRGADRVARQLQRAGASAAAIHGSRSQSQRNRALQSFADGKVEALVATDVAARGIHVEGVACVLHFDPPIDHKTYVHRSGRTARAGAQGVVVSFVDGDQLREADALVRDLQLRANLSTPAPASLQAAIERLSADPHTSFADVALALADAEDLRRQRPHAGATAEPPSGRRRRNNGSRARGSVAGADAPRRDRGPTQDAGNSRGGRREERPRSGSGPRSNGSRPRSGRRLAPRR